MTRVSRSFTRAFLSVVSAAFTLVAFLPSMAGAFPAQANKSVNAQADPPALQADYREIVGLYAAGDSTAALALFGSWNDTRIRAQIERLKASVVTIRSCSGCPDRQRFAAFPLRAALLLHADREIQQNFHPPVSEQAAACGVGLNAELIEHLAAILILIDPKAGEFLRPFYLGMARQAEWSHCFTESQIWARVGLKTYANDARLRMALGIASETAAFFTLPLAPSNLSSGVVAARESEMVKAKLREYRETARQSFVEALSADPNLVEARLRLGRMQWQLGQPDNARASFEAVLTKGGDESLQYLGHLFLGRVLEDRGQLAEAEIHYRAALSLQPLSETPAVALSHARFLQGDMEGARATLGLGLEATRRRAALDPWVSYLVSQTNDGEAILDELRRGLIR